MNLPEQENLALAASVVREAYDEGRVTARAKCCGKCAFRPGSPERCDPFGWLRLSEAFAGGQVFLCHEGIPGHAQQVTGAPLQVCAGWAALQGQPVEAWVELAHCADRDPDPRFFEATNHKPQEAE